MKVGDLVRHEPNGSPIEVILRKIDGCNEGDLTPDFEVGVIIQKAVKRSRVHSVQLYSACWYDNSELKILL